MEGVTLEDGPVFKLEDPEMYLYYTKFGYWVISEWVILGDKPETARFRSENSSKYKIPVIGWQAYNINHQNWWNFALEVFSEVSNRKKRDTESIRNINFITSTSGTQKTKTTTITAAAQTPIPDAKGKPKPKSKTKSKSKAPTTTPSTSATSLPAVDVFLNPSRQADRQLAEQYQRDRTRALFDLSNMTEAYPHLFRLLRHSNLPCFSSEQVIWGLVRKPGQNDALQTVLPLINLLIV